MHLNPSLLLISLCRAAFAKGAAIETLDLVQKEAVESLTSVTATATATFNDKDIHTASSTSTVISSCNPLSTSTCGADPALATDISNDFTDASSHYIPYRTPSQIFYTDEGLQLTLAERFDNPSLVSDFYIMFGKVEVLLKSANGTGIISSFYLQSDDLDEIDMEWFGGDASQMQSNFFSKGDTTSYDRGGYHDMPDPRTSYHNYTLDWTETSLTWYIDGTAVRTLANDTSSGYPQSPMRLFFGIWAGGDSTNEAGTIEWAGGETDYTQAPFSMYIQKLVVSDYSTGSEYSYSDTTGDWTSIAAKDGSVNGRKQAAQVEFAKLVGGEDVSSSSSSSFSSSSSSSSPDSSSSSDSSSSHSLSNTSFSTTTLTGSTLMTKTTSNEKVITRSNTSIVDVTTSASTSTNSNESMSKNGTTSKASSEASTSSVTISAATNAAMAICGNVSGFLAFALVVLNLM